MLVCHPRSRVLGHVLTPEGLKTNPATVSAVREFPVPTKVRQFLGLSCFYRRFINGFAAIAQSLHRLTQKGVHFQWSVECQQAFETLKRLLTSAPVLAYPRMEDPFVLETDASILGLGAILSQQQPDGTIHPVAYASRSLNQAERNYRITELETLAAVWAVTHFRAYLYGNSVRIYTDHSAVKAVLYWHLIRLGSMLDGGLEFMGQETKRWILCTDLASRVPTLTRCRGVHCLAIRLELSRRRTLNS